MEENPREGGGRMGWGWVGEGGKIECVVTGQ